ncbi:hypothetical protein ACOSQ2_022950 [Xanthoceras sorbifolium]
MMEGVNSFYDQLSMAQDVKKGKLVLSPKRGLERASTRDSAYFNSRIRSLGSTRGGLPGEGSPRSPMANPSEASPSSLVIHSPSSEVFNSMKHTLGCLVMVSAIKLNVDPSVLMGGIHELLKSSKVEVPFCLRRSRGSVKPPPLHAFGALLKKRAFLSNNNIITERFALASLLGPLSSSPYQSQVTAPTRTRAVATVMPPTPVIPTASSIPCWPAAPFVPQSFDGHVLLVESIPCQTPSHKSDPWVIGDHYLTISPWTPGFLSSEATIDSVGAWVRVPNLPLEDYATTALIGIGDAIG